MKHSHKLATDCPSGEKFSFPVLVLVVDLLVIVLIAVLVVISFGISTKVIWSALIALWLSLYFFITIRRLNVNKTDSSR